MLSWFQSSSLQKSDENDIQEFLNLSELSEDSDASKSDDSSIADFIDLAPVDMNQFIFRTPPDGSSLVCKLQDAFFLEFGNE